jgi:hypothetical protein
MKTKTKIKSVKKTTKSNVVDIPKQIKELKITLERGTDGKWIKDLNYYYNQDPERQVSTDDAVMLLNNLVSKSTLERNRRDNKDDNGSRGPQYRKLTERVVIYKILWLMRFREGLAWIKVEQELKPSYAVTATNIPSSNVVGMKKNY